MIVETLSEKVYGPNMDRALISLKFSLERAFEGLEVSVVDVHADGEGWVSVSLDGEDVEVAVEYVTRLYGKVLRRGEASRLSEVRGRLSKISPEGLTVDVGPGGLKAFVPWEWLRIQLSPNAETVQDAAETFCMVENIPVYVKILDPTVEPMEAKLSERQVRLYASWTKSGLDRVVVTSTTRSRLKKALKASGLIRNVVGIEQLGVLEHAVPCKLASDPMRVAETIVKRIPESTVALFDPEKAREKMGSRLMYP